MFHIVTYCIENPNPDHRRFVNVLVAGDPIDWFVNLKESLLFRNTTKYVLISCIDITRDQYNKLEELENNKKKIQK